MQITEPAILRPAREGDCNIIVSYGIVNASEPAGIIPPRARSSLYFTHDHDRAKYTNERRFCVMAHHASSVT
jgi:hypothetical protein